MVREHAGVVDGGGVVTGVTFNAETPHITAPWRADRRATCRAVAALVGGAPGEPKK